MSELAQTITNDMKEAMKAKDVATLSTLRMLIASLKNKKIDLMRELTDEEVQDAVKLSVKQLKDAMVSFKTGDRMDAVESAQAEICVLEKYLPAQLSDETLRKVVTEALAQSGATSKADMGKAMSMVMKAVAGRADGNRVKEIVSVLLPVLLLGVFVAFPVFASIPLVKQPAVTDSTMNLAFALRLIRVGVLWFGVIGISLIIKGGFHYMVSSMRDDEHKHAMASVTSGVMTSIVVAGLFGILTVTLQQIA